ncbi:MAG: TPM domain-containing protein [Bacteroidota bacterium]|nr:TPM domain-containing protein [Bacteroidota bacterium]MDP4234773.1 TPM domain-containing protein [Bacteroidota bacterium]MDP4244147.1 TPM domain-containing protein [Bacteroidota bacterium]MDP4289297.1 TPM domain-containing protein [Bacteroidota bacterium]
MEHPTHANDAFSKDVLERIAQRIADVEHTTGADIRISVRDLRDAGEADLSIKDLAEKEFAMLGLHTSKDHAGILIFILYHEKRFYVCGDAGVHSRVHPEAWKDVAHELGSHFLQADYEGGVLSALHKIEHHLKPKHAA